MLYKARYIVCWAVLLSILSSCDETVSPKPKGYFRITFPEKSYVTYEGGCPFRFDYPVYGAVHADKGKNAAPCWLNLDYPAFKARLHISYNPVNNNIRKLLEDARTLANKHQVKASSIDEQLVLRDSSRVYGLIYDIGGNAASSFQFYLTDSTQHFLRGALYFNVAPNIDSVAPVVKFLKEDLYRMIHTFEWTSAGPPKN